MSKLPGISLRLLFAAALLACFTIAPASHAEPAGADDGPGIAILASSVDNGESVEDLLSFVKEARVREVVIDWAWITLHWEHTKFDRVNALVEKLKAEKVHVAAMYRPRFKAFQAKTYTIKAQVNADGQLPDGREILYADPEARKWGTQWAVDILTKCPAFDEVVIYNPSQFDQSEASKNARKKNADYDNDSVHKFLEETRKAIREVKQDAKLGLVRPPAEWAFKPFRDVVDVDRPYAVVRDDTDFDKNMDAALNVMSQTKTAGPALAKITWGEDYKVSDEKLAEFIKTARKKKLRYCFWTFDTTFLEGNYDLDSLCKAAGLDAGKLKSIIRDLGGKTDLKFPAEEVQKAVDDAMDEPGYTAVLEAVKKYGEQVIGPMTKILDDTERSVVDRWRAAGALGQTKSPKALEVLLRNSKDKEDMVRWLCADGIGWCGKGSKEARERLKEMGENDPAMRKDQKGETVYYVRDTAKRALAKLSQREPGEEEAFFKNMPWAETLEDALDRAKKENKLVVLFVNPFDNPAYECGYRGADNYAKEQRAKQKDEPRPDVGQVKERAMLAGLLCEPRNAAFVRQRCVLVRMRLHYRHWTDVYNDEPHALKAVGMDDKNVGAPAVLAISPEGKIVAHAHDMTIYCPELFWKIAATAMEACELSTPEPLKQAQDALAKNDGPENFIALLNAQLDAGEHKDFRKLAALAPKKAADEATLLQAEADLVEGNAQSAFDRLENFKAPNDRFHARKNALLAEALVRLGRPEEADGLYRATVHGTLPMDGVLWRLLFFDCLAKDRLGKTEGRSEMPGGSWADEEDPWCVRALMYHQPNGPNPDEWCRFTDLPLPDVLSSTETGRNGESGKTASGDLNAPIRKAAEYLIGRQRGDGSWEGPASNMLLSGGQAYFDAFAVARTALATCALDEALPLLDKPLGARARQAVEKGLKYIHEWQPQASVFPATYALYAELKFYDDLSSKEKKAAKERINKLLETLQGIEHDGGWTYTNSPEGRLHTFNTAPILINLAMLRELKLGDVDDMIERAQKFLEQERVGDLAVFHYGSSMHHLTSVEKPKGGSMRSTLCELALVQSGVKDERKKRLGESVDLFFEYIDDVRSTAKRWESFFSPDAGHDAYHYYFGTWYASQAILELPDAKRIKADSKKLAEKLLLTQELDGGYCDAQISDGRNTATAMALMTLVNCKKGQD